MSSDGFAQPKPMANHRERKRAQSAELQQTIDTLADEVAAMKTQQVRPNRMGRGAARALPASAQKGGMLEA